MIACFASSRHRLTVLTLADDELKQVVQTAPNARWAEKSSEP